MNIVVENNLVTSKAAYGAGGTVLPAGPVAPAEARS
jgi:hypothetical protein